MVAYPWRLTAGELAFEQWSYLKHGRLLGTHGPRRRGHGEVALQQGMQGAGCFRYVLGRRGSRLRTAARYR